MLTLVFGSVAALIIWWANEDRSSRYARPAPGTGTVGVWEANWCKGVLLGIEHRRKSVDTASEIDSFNRDVGEYNRRCGSKGANTNTWNAAEHRAEASAAWWRKNYEAVLWNRMRVTK